MQNLGELKETRRTRGQGSALPLHVHSRQILDLMKAFVNRWSPLIHASHCMTTSRPAAAIQTKSRVHRCILHAMPFLSQPSLFPCSTTDSEYAGLHILSWVAETTLLIAVKVWLLH